ncbi:MAG: hypothetical protein WCI50_01725 [Actinomycetes bacterium]
MDDSSERTARTPTRRTLLVVAVVITLAAALLVTAATTLGQHCARTASTANTRTDATWILSAQMPDGALATYRDRQFIDPYLASLAVVGLVRAYAVTRDNAAISAAWRWLSWYAAHLDRQGVVHNDKVVNGTAVDTGSVDSTDGSSAVFLLAVYETWKATNDRNALVALAPAIAGAVGAIELTQDADGMTWATPTFHVKYLMNEAGGHGLGRALVGGRCRRADRPRPRCAPGLALGQALVSGAYELPRSLRSVIAKTTTTALTSTRTTAAPSTVPTRNSATTCQGSIQPRRRPRTTAQHPPTSESAPSANHHPTVPPFVGVGSSSHVALPSRTARTGAGEAGTWSGPVGAR